MAPPGSGGMRHAKPTHHTIDYVEFSSGNLVDSKTFYAEAFGWSFNDYGPQYAGIVEGEGEAGGLTALNDPLVAPLVILYSENLDESLASVEAAGGEITQSVYDFPGGRRFHFRDPAGHDLAVWGS